MSLENFRSSHSITLSLCVVQLLDRLVVQKPQLSVVELTLLSMSVLAASSSPLILGGSAMEFLAPSAAACKLVGRETFAGDFYGDH